MWLALCGVQLCGVIARCEVKMFSHMRNAPNAGSSPNLNNSNLVRHTPIVIFCILSLENELALTGF